MANIARIRLPGFWIQNSVVDPDEFEALDEIRPWLANFTAGSSHTPSAFITVGGSGFQLTGTGHEVAASSRLNVQSAGEIRLENGATVRVNGTGGDIVLRVSSNVALLDVDTTARARILTGGSLEVYGDLTITNTDGPGAATWEDNTTANFEDGSVLTLESGAQMVVDDGGQIRVAGQILLTADGDITVPSAGQIQGASGSIVTLAGTNSLSSLALVGGSTWPSLSTARAWERSSLDVAWCTFSAGQLEGSAGEAMDIWSEQSDVSTGRALRTNPMGASGAFSVIQFREIPQYGVITEVAVKTKGINNTVTAYPQFRIIRWRDGEAAYDTLSSLVTDGHSGTGNFDTTIVETTITPTSSPTVIDKVYNYGLLILHPYYTGLSTAVRIYNVKVTGTIATMRMD